MSRLQDKYRQEILPKLKEELKMTNDLAVPRLKKITINIGLGEAKDNAGIMEKVLTNLVAIAGQKPVATKAKKSISNFKIAQGQAIGAMVTLRGVRMYDFLDKLMTIVLPKVRDFRGISATSFDQGGNYTLGLREQVIFAEVDYRNVDKIRGMEITIGTTAHNKEEGKRLLELMGMPFRKDSN